MQRLWSTHTVRKLSCHCELHDKRDWNHRRAGTLCIRRVLSSTWNPSHSSLRKAHLVGSHTTKRNYNDQFVRARCLLSMFHCWKTRSSDFRRNMRMVWPSCWPVVFEVTFTAAPGQFSHELAKRLQDGTKTVVTSANGVFFNSCGVMKVT